MKVADGEDCYGVAPINHVEEDPWHVGEYGTE